MTDPREFLKLQGEWDALCERASGYNFSQSFAWCRCAWETIAAPGHRRLHCIVARQAGRAVLIWPMVIDRRSLWSILRPLGSETTEYSDMLIEDGPDADARAAAAWRTLRESCRTDIIKLRLVRAGSRLHRVVTAGRAARVELVQQATYLARADHRDWESYFRSLSKDFRSELKRKRRRLADMGRLETILVTEPGERERVLDWMLARKREWLKKAKLDNPWLHSKEYRDFLLAIMAEPSPSGSIMIQSMTLDGRIVAAQLSSVDKRRLEGFIGAYDSALGKYSPGMILLEDCLKWAFERGLDVDFRIGNESYKRTWTNREVDATDYAIANSRLGTLYAALSQIILEGNRAKQRLLRLFPAPWRRAVKGVLGSVDSLPPGAKFEQNEFAQNKFAPSKFEGGQPAVVRVDGGR